MDISEITADNLIAILRDPQQRDRLQQAMRQEDGRYLPLTNHYAKLASICTASPEQLHTTVKMLLTFKRRYEELLCELIFHPDMPEQTLLLLCEKRCCISALGHRRGSQRLLERVVAKYRYSEAITTLALSYYSSPDYPTEAFAAFLQQHADDYMLRYNILRHTDLPPDKWEVVQRLFAVPEEAI